MKKIFLLSVIILLNINLFAQTDDVYYSPSTDTTKVDTEILAKRTPGDWLIISANREFTSLACYGIAIGLSQLNIYLLMENPNSYDPLYLSITAIGVSITGLVYYISSISAKKRAGQAMNKLGLDFKTTSDGLSLSFKL